MQNLDELLKQQRDLIIRMDAQHQRQMNSLHERIARVESQIQEFHQNADNNNSNNNDQNQLSSKISNQKSNVEFNKNSLNQTYTAPSASQAKLPRLNSSFPR